jgi:carboxypeptidase Taq
MAKTTTESEHAWRQARSDNDFKAFLPWLTKILELTREAAQAKSEALQVGPYQALVDQYDPGLKLETIDRCFSELREFIPGAIDQAIANQRETLLPLPGPVPAENQQRLSRTLMEWLGFDFTQGRLDTSTHPFAMMK